MQGTSRATLLSPTFTIFRFIFFSILCCEMYRMRLSCVIKFAQAGITRHSHRRAVRWFSAQACAVLIARFGYKLTPVGAAEIGQSELLRCRPQAS